MRRLAGQKFGVVVVVGGSVCTPSCFAEIGVVVVVGGGFSGTRLRLLFVTFLTLKVSDAMLVSA